VKQASAFCGSSRKIDSSSSSARFRQFGFFVYARARRKIRLHDAQQALTTIMRFHHLLDSLLAARDLPRDERELDRLIEIELQRVKGSRAVALIEGEISAGTTMKLG
jgi:hypothetical protein